MPWYDLLGNGGILKCAYSAQTRITGRWATFGPLMLDEEGTLYFDRGYAWDFGTGAIDTPAVVLASLVHDGLTDMIRAGVLPKSVRKQADKEYKRWLKKGGMSWWRIQLQYYGIRFYVRVIKPFM